ncbi:MAG: hypothetical protein COA78_38265, partial [Blastopirellula sp.]
EAARRLQCTNNLKQIGLGIHNFHDTFNGMPPLLNHSERMSMFVHIMPFLEQGNAYDMLDGSNIRGIASATDKTSLNNSMKHDAGNNNWAKLEQSEKDALGSIKYMVCPSRRSGTQIAEGDNQAQGPLSDYAVVFLWEDLDQTNQGASWNEAGWWGHHNTNSSGDIEKQKGAIVVAKVDHGGPAATKFRNGKPRATFASITDGMSNTLIVGDKHVSVKQMGKCCDTHTSGTDYRRGTDGSYLYNAGGWREYLVTRNIRHRFGRGPNDDANADVQVGFGSNHPGIVQFLVADGSVKNVTTTITEWTRRQYGHRSDGTVISN